MGVSKVVYGDRTLIDLTESTVTPETLLKGSTAVNAAGELIEGIVEPANLYFEKEEDGSVIPLANVTFEQQSTNLFFKTKDGSTLELGSLSIKS